MIILGPDFNKTTLEYLRDEPGDVAGNDDRRGQPDDLPTVFMLQYNGPAAFQIDGMEELQEHREVASEQEEMKHASSRQSRERPTVA